MHLNLSSGEIKVGIKFFSSEAEEPHYSKPGDGACDLKSVSDHEVRPLGRTLVATGIGLEIPEGFGGFVLPRSGLAINHGITCLNAPGLIDSGYRGEIKVVLFNSDGENTFIVKKGDRVAQFLIIALPYISFNPVEELSETIRGTGGFGHTGI